jgi:hypothetical protein
MSGPPTRDLHSLRVMLCESELAAYLRKYPTLSREEIFQVVLAHGPARAPVESALEALAGKP